MSRRDDIFVNFNKYKEETEERVNEKVLQKLNLLTKTENRLPAKKSKPNRKNTNFCTAQTFLCLTS